MTTLEYALGMDGVSRTAAELMIEAWKRYPIEVAEGVCCGHPYFAHYVERVDGDRCVACVLCDKPTGTARRLCVRSATRITVAWRTLDDE